MQLPDKVYKTLVEVCEAYPWDRVQQGFHIGEILNAVAYAHRADGWGLSRKTGGKRVDSPVGEIAEDILQLPDGNHFDVLGGIDVGQPLRPGRASSIGIINLNSRPWVKPVDHPISWLVTKPEEPEEPKEPEVPNTPCSFKPCECKGVSKEDFEQFKQRVEELAAHFDKIGAQLVEQLGAKSTPEKPKEPELPWWARF
jgi:hypothetical protein